MISFILAAITCVFTAFSFAELGGAIPISGSSYWVPFFPVSPVLGVAFCLYLIYGTGWATWVRFGVFLAAGAIVYALDGRRLSRLVSRAGPERQEA
ncbi:amino acid permease C-terminal domain-containing protein [Streptomyces sp. A5-4]|uniref:amino acid permease C-terminal domain-containing protein n=1 Tax=Streptomyces sp. A5-4 TaxID=3384771 RepID=UPI003DA907A3